MGDTAFFTTGRLRGRGMTTGGIRAAIGHGTLERVIRGWCCTPATDRDAVRAMRLGGRLGCVSSLHLQGAWRPPEPGLHVLFPSHASGRRLATRSTGAECGARRRRAAAAAACTCDARGTPGVDAVSVAPRGTCGCRTRWVCGSRGTRGTAR